MTAIAGRREIKITSLYKTYLKKIKKTPSCLFHPKQSAVLSAAFLIAKRSNSFSFSIGPSLTLTYLFRPTALYPSIPIGFMFTVELPYFVHFSLRSMPFFPVSSDIPLESSEIHAARSAKQKIKTKNQIIIIKYTLNDIGSYTYNLSYT